MEPAIRVRHLRKQYGDSVAVRDISFTVEQGEVFCLLGPNGAGKTTTTEILEGYRLRTGGQVRVLGFDPGRGERAYRSRIGIVLQECGVQADLTVGEVLGMYGAYYEDPLPVAEVVRLVELDAKVDERVRNLSGGQRRRLDVGLALVGDPDLLFLDEPTTGFDPSARRQSWATLKALTDLGKTILLTTHFMDEAQALADRVAVVAGGELVAEGSPDSLGGAQRSIATVSASLPPDADLAGLDLPASVEHGRLVVATADALTATHRLTSWALDRRIDLPDLTVSHPSLEDVYLQLTSGLVDARTTEAVR